MKKYPGVMAAAVGLSLALGVAGCGSSSDPAAGGGGSCKADSATATKSVAVKNNLFDPACIKVAAGDTVTWKNEGMASHTVTADEGATTFDSKALGDGGEFQFTFSAAGTVAYYCVPHKSQGMTATVIVQ